MKRGCKVSIRVGYSIMSRLEDWPASPIAPVPLKRSKCHIYETMKRGYWLNCELTKITFAASEIDIWKAVMLLQLIEDVKSFGDDGLKAAFVRKDDRAIAFAIDIADILLARLKIRPREARRDKLIDVVSRYKWILEAGAIPEIYVED